MNDLSAHFWLSIDSLYELAFLLNMYIQIKGKNERMWIIKNSEGLHESIF